MGTRCSCRRSVGNYDGCYGVLQKRHIDARAAQPGPCPSTSEHNALSIKPPPTRIEPRSWLPSEHIDLANDAEVSALAARLSVTPGELREIFKELGDRTAPVAVEACVPMQTPGKQDFHGMPRAGPPE